MQRRSTACIPRGDLRRDVCPGRHLSRICRRWMQERSEVSGPVEPWNQAHLPLNVARQYCYAVVSGGWA